MKKVEAKKFLNGAHGTCYFNGLPVFEMENVSAEIEVRRAEEQIGMDVDSKILGLSGKGTLTLRHTYDRGFSEFLEAYKKGLDPRSVMEVVINDPDSFGGQRETVSIQNVWFNNIKLLEIEVGEIVKKTHEFGFTPTSSGFTEVIN